MTAYEDTVKNIRARRDEKTASDPLHWLNLAGLFWLKEGENPFGSDVHAVRNLPHSIQRKSSADQD